VEADLHDEDLSQAEERVRAVLDAIAGDRWVNLRVPHGFAITSTAAERRANWFPEGTEHVRVLARLKLPVVFHARAGRATYASHENLDGLRAWIVEDCRRAPGRIELAEWEVSPTNDPRPRRRGEPEQHWHLAAEFRVDF
jgi:hypothetical protein